MKVKQNINQNPYDMRQLLEEFRYRIKFLDSVNYEEAQSRLTGLYKWLMETEETKKTIQNIQSSIEIPSSNLEIPSTPEEIIAFGVYLLEKIANGSQLYDLAYEHDIKDSYGSTNLQSVSDALFNKYIVAVIDYIESELEQISQTNNINLPSLSLESQLNYPPEIHQSLQKFFKDYPIINRNAFIMMQFGQTKAHNLILKSIKDVLSKYGINALRADDKEFHEDLFPNVLTYLYGCKFGIAIFERLEDDEFNPNVSLEVGYLRALKKPICLLKDKTLKTLQTDLVGKLYRSFDPQEPEKTIPTELEKWLRDKEIIS
jgi:hypothetical protein